MAERKLLVGDPATRRHTPWAVGDVVVHPDGQKTLDAEFSWLRPLPNTPPDNTITIQPGSYLSQDGTKILHFAGGTCPAIPVCPAFSRFDLVVIDDTGVLQLVAGAPAATPVAPSFPTDKVTLAVVLVTESASVAVTSLDLQDGRGLLHAPSSGGGGGVSAHSALSGLQGGDVGAGEFYHLDKDEYDACAGTGTPSSSNPYITADTPTTTRTPGGIPKGDAVDGNLNEWITEVDGGSM